MPEIGTSITSNDHKMFFIVIAAWIAGVIISFKFGNRKLPTTILLIGLGVTAAHFTVGLGYIYIVVMAIISVIIWLANKMEMT